MIFPLLSISISLIITYLIGSIPFAYIYGKLFRNIDIRNFGSGNIGATNVLRILGKKAGIIVLILDMLKGFLPVFIVKEILQWNMEYAWLPVLIGIFAILGHTFTIFLLFKGGKGVATAAGVFLALTPIVLLIAFSFFIAVVALTKYVSLGSIFAALFVVTTNIFSYSSNDPYVFYFSLIVAFFIIFKHKSNIIRLLKGTENKINFNNKKNGDNK
ncbi:MAG: glycerol-3-phosphate 1-O-acyltransferase PlsY [Candidatus Cloacimonetes bacterium]|jgi:glycerol-3-phosphate acyltransferase PlsY|nr:glycerol-3-phosphate 1-O-acyltransferase PlsY [Candidatus Cloacimonadota bacterium]